MKIKNLLTFLIIFVVGCTNPFSVRTPESPYPGNIIKPANSLQTDPDSLLSKLRYAFLQKNPTFYNDCLSDSNVTGRDFIFIPEKDETYRLTNWSRQDELNYFNNLINNRDLREIQIRFYDKSPWDATQTSTDTLQTQLSYEIKLKFRGREENYQGRSILKVLRSSLSQWYIFYWEDFKLTDHAADSTWSTLKATYRYN